MKNASLHKYRSQLPLAKYTPQIVDHPVSARRIMKIFVRPEFRGIMKFCKAETACKSIFIYPGKILFYDIITDRCEKYIAEMLSIRYPGGYLIIRRRIEVVTTGCANINISLAELSAPRRYINSN